MNRIAIVLLLLWISGVSIAQSVASQEQRLVDLSNRKFEWLINKQYDSLDKLLDERVQYIHSNGWIQNRKEVIEDLKSGKLNYMKVAVKESLARVYGNTGIVTGLGLFEGTTEGNPFSLNLRYTEVYVKSGKHWKLASRHSNRMP